MPLTAESSIADFQKAYGEASFLSFLTREIRKETSSKKSQVIATSSIGGFNRAVPGGFAYGQSKAATTHLMKQLATGLAPFGIRSNTLAPGLFPSELAAGIIGDGVFPRSVIPLERVGTEEDMAGVILFLTSRAGAYLTGTVLLVDGGRLSLMLATY